MRYGEILILEFDSDIGETTIEKYFKELLLTLWRKGEGFSGKRPFGNSGWEYDLYKPLVKTGVIKGEVDEWGYIEEVDEDAASDLIVNLIFACFDEEKRNKDYRDDRGSNDQNLQR